LPFVFRTAFLTFDARRGGSASLRSRSGSATHTQTCADRAGRSALLSRRHSTRLLVVHSAGDDPIRVAGASRGRQARDHARRTARRRS
jgi:hypothetical protein